MKVLMYGWEFPPDISGGLGVACFGIVNELVKKGMSVFLVLPKGVKNVIQSDKISIIGCNEIRDVGNRLDLKSLGICSDEYKEIESPLHPYLTEHCYEQILNNLGQCYLKHYINQNNFASLTGKYGPNLLAEVFRYAAIAGGLSKNIQHDVIHAHDWLTGLAGIEAKRYSNKPFVFHVHALEYDRSGENINQTVFLIEKHIMKTADKIVSVSQYTKNIIVNRYGIPDDKISVVHNGTYGPEVFPFEPICRKNNKAILFVGRVTYQKGLWHFIEAAKKILEKCSNVHFVIAGTGDQLKEMIERVAELKIGKNVHFTGFLCPREIQELYKSVRVYVMPSVSEPFGLACLEALSNNVPVVVSKQSGVAEVLNHVLKVDFWDSDEMVNKIMALLNYSALRKEALKGSEAELKNLTWAKAAEKLIKIYEDVAY